MGDFTTARVTTCSGSPIADNQKSAAAGARGPALTQDWRSVVAPAIKPDRLRSNS
jgi:catalase